MAYDGFYASLSTRASVNEILNQALAAKEEITTLTTSTVQALDEAIDIASGTTLVNQQIQSQVQQTAATAALSAGRAELSAVEANTYAGLSLTNATASEDSLEECQEIVAELGDVQERFDAVDAKFLYYDARIQPIQQTTTSALDEDVAVVGGGVQAEFKSGIRQPPVGIVTAYSSRVVVRPSVAWNQGWTSGFANGIIAEDGGERINKMVVSYCQTDALNKGSSAILGYEHSLGAIGPLSNHDALSDFFAPNLEFVPNKHRVAKMAAFTNQDTGKVVQSFGPYVDKRFRELAPAPHPGYVAGRWYTNPFWYAGTIGISIPANTAWLKPMNIAARVLIETVRVYVAGGAGSYRLGIFSAVQGRVSEKEFVSPIVNNPGAATFIDFPVNKQFDPGTYYFSAACSVAGSTLGEAKGVAAGSDQAWRFGVTDPDLKEGNGDVILILQFPSLADMDNANPNVAPTYMARKDNNTEPRILFKVGVITAPSLPGNGRPTNN